MSRPGPCLCGVFLVVLLSGAVARDIGTAGPAHIPRPWSEATVAPQTRAAAAPRVVVVRTTGEFRAALGSARPGTVIEVSPGRYEGGSYHDGIAGTAGAPIVIRAADPNRRPVFSGGYNGIQISNARHLAFEDLIFEGASQNGVSIDDGETFDTPSHHVRFTRVTVRNLPEGNHDGIKLSGVTDFVVEDSTIERWGGGGSGVDMVGCHRGTIRGNVFRHTPGMPTGNGVQAKGGSTGITIAGNRFEDAAARAVQIGGQTSLTQFRPQPPGRAEATAIVVEHNVIVGGESAIAFVGSDGGVVRFNTIYLPARWPIRILQEHTAVGLARCRNGVFTGNLVYWRGGLMINVGDGTDAASFTFARNSWFREDAPGQSRLPLPSAEADGVYGVDPQFVAPPRDLQTKRPVPYGAFAGRR